MKLTYKDEGHQYWLDGRRCKGVTGIAKIPDDTFNLERWRARAIVVGLASAPPLIERAAAHWDDRGQLDLIADEAITVAKGKEAAGRGQAIHRVTERVDLGQDIVYTPLAQAVETSWLRALDAAGLDIEPEFVERIVVYPDMFIAGRMDRYVRRRSDGRLAVLDLKTGPNAVKYPHSIAIQLALYTNAPLLAGPLPPAGGTTFDFAPLPDDLDREWGYILHMPAENQATAVPINIAAGWQAVQQIIFPVLNWRARNDLLELPIPPVIDPQLAYEALLDRIEWVRGRVDAIKDAGHGGELARLWSGCPSIPTFPKGGPTTMAQVDGIAALCDTVETNNSMPFSEPDPITPPIRENK